MRRRWFLMMAAGVALGSCGDSPSGVLSVSQIAGEYELVRFLGQPLPADNFARGTVEARHISLLTDQRYTRTWRGTTCALGSCARADGSDSGYWMVLADGTVYFDSQAGTSWPPQRVEANGRELRVLIPTGDTQFTLGEVYERR